MADSMRAYNIERLHTESRVRILHRGSFDHNIRRSNSWEVCYGTRNYNYGT